MLSVTAGTLQETPKIAAEHHYSGMARPCPVLGALMLRIGI
jgi:hypothetical protein